MREPAEPRPDVPPHETPTIPERRDLPPPRSRTWVWVAILVALVLAAVATYACTGRVPVDQSSGPPPGLPQATG
jgi:hypothetical protein